VSVPDTRSGAEVRVDNLVKLYGSVPAVDGVSAVVGPGEFFTILGPSGSGKTTMMMMIAGFVYPTSGTISIGAQNVADLPPQNRGLGMVFQNYAVFPNLTVYENVAFPLRVRKKPKAEIKSEVDAMLDLVKIKELSGRMPRELSGGQQQRVALARALVFRPSVLLMDEPLGALDKKLRDHMQAEIRRIHRSLGVTVIYVTHDQDEALTMSDRVAIMNHGRIEQVGSPSELYDRPNTRFVADFLGDTNFIPGTLIEAGNGEGRVRTQDGRDISGALASDSLQVNSDVVVGVRPEKFRITDAVDRSLNSCTGVVDNIVYSGASTTYEIKVVGGSDLIVTSPNRNDIVPQKVGQSITVVWDRIETRIFAA
jgi:putative spermidine/putrescine transport system ATP-binding protein